VDALLTIEGVLRARNQPIQSGVALFRALVGRYRVTLLADEPAEDARIWLVSHGIADWAGILGTEHAIASAHSLRDAQIKLAKYRGPVELLVDPDPGVVAGCFDYALTGVLFVPPAVAAAQFRPDAPREVRRWTDIEAAVDAQRALSAKAADDWVDEMYGEAWEREQ
jgi:hypothetical protein